MNHREVSPIEMYSVGRHNLDYYRTVSFYLRFEISSSVLSMQEWYCRIERAVRLTIEAQPRLRLQVDQSQTSPYFIVLPMEFFDKLPMRVIDRPTESNDDFLLKTMEDEVNTSFVYDRSSPLWRLTLLTGSNSQSFDLILSFNHAIADGVSGMAFFTTLIAFLNEKNPPHYQLSDDLPLDKIIPKQSLPLLSLLLQIIEKLILPKFLNQYFFPKTYWTGDVKVTGQETNETRLISFTLTSSIVDGLLRETRREKTTVHGALVAALLLSIAEIFGNENIELFCNSAVNLRPYCQPKISNQQMGVFLCAVDSTHFIRCSNDLDELFWPLARQIKEQICLGIENSILPLVDSLRFVTDWNDFLRKQRQNLPNGLQHSVDVSNLLSWSFNDDNGHWKISEGGFTQSSNIIGSQFTASVVTVNGVLHFFICFQKSRMNPLEKVYQLKDRMKHYLIKASKVCEN